MSNSFPRTGLPANFDIPTERIFNTEIDNDLFNANFFTSDVTLPASNFNDALTTNSPTSGSSSKSSSAPSPRRTAASTIKEKLLKPAHTSHFECHFNPPGEVITWMSNRNLNPTDPNNQRLITLSCSETALPGSRMATNTLQDDHHGVTERHAYRRQFDDTASFTFYVDAPKSGSEHGYKLIWFFEQWKSFIMNEEDRDISLDAYNWYYRAKFPETYMTNIFITKFERDIDLVSINPSKSTKKYLEYMFLQAFPISINTMPVSYDQSQVLKCTVSFAFSRYILKRKTGFSEGDALPNSKTSFNLDNTNAFQRPPSSTERGPIPLEVIPFRP